MAELTDPAIEALWKNCLDHWEEEKAHVAFVDACRERGKLAEAGARYRGMAGDRDRAPEAEKRLKSILAIAMASLEVARTPEPVVKRRANALAVLVVLLAGTIGLVAYISLVR
jgi:hypothetical protein